MRKHLAAGITAACICTLVLAASLYAQITTVISFGPAVTVLSTTSTGAVNGSTFALPGTNANVLTWQITADGSALNASLQVSLDGTNWVTLSTCSTASGCIYNSGVNAYVFVRAIQTSRTGGTTTTSQINTDRAYGTSAGRNPVVAGNITFSPDNTYDIGASGANRPRSEYIGTSTIIGTNPAAAGTIRTPHGFILNSRNSANSVDIPVINYGSSVTDNLIVGGSGVPTRIRSSMSVPGTLANGDWWVECSGTSPARTCSLKAQQLGATVNIVTSAAF